MRCDRLRRAWVLGSLGHFDMRWVGAMDCASAHNDARKLKEKILGRQFAVKNRDSKKLAGFKSLRAESWTRPRSH